MPEVEKMTQGTNQMNKTEVTVAHGDFSVSLAIVGNAFSEFSNVIRNFPDFEKSLLEGMMKKLIDFHSEISKLEAEFNKINKAYLSKEEEVKLWVLDDSVGRARANLLAEEIKYKINIRPTVSQVLHSDAIIDAMDALLRNLIDISETLRTIIRSKVSWFEMQQSIKSGKRLEKSTYLLLLLTIFLIILTAILALRT
jgi:hypothetical protein